MYIENINGPADVKKLNIKQMTVLASEIRDALLTKLSRHGGHFGPNFGMIEATIALHYVFESPKDKFVFDVSHQSYPHKMLTGRKNAFLYEEHYDDVSGYSNPHESEHDHFTIGHTSTSVSLACGLAKGRDLKGEDGKTYCAGYCYEAFGIIVNTELLEKAGHSLDEIKDFASLKAVAEDITARKDELGFSAFTSAGMDGSSDWRFKTHLANLPIYFEYQADGIDTTDAIKGTYLDDYKNIFDLYINNSTCDPAELAGKTGDDSRNEFLNNEAVFFQNGSWEYNNLVGDGKPFTDEDLTMLPIYIGVGDEANQGLCTGTENFWCVNKEASADDIQATLDFMYWCVTSEEGTTAMANDMGFVIPFKKAVESPNLFVKVDNALTAAGKTPVAWCFSTMPSENWKNGVGSALTAYAAGTGTWDAVVSAFVDGWATEAALNAAA